MLTCQYESSRAREESRISCSTPTTPSTGIRGATRRSRGARRRTKPIFLSIGYSTCHWCHVMEHESFEDASVAAVLNRDFVSIKLDREERPDVDRVYMMFVQATTGAGGWPMSVWLTPDLKPFFGGTYFPPASRWGRPGFVDVLTRARARVARRARPAHHSPPTASSSGCDRRPAPTSRRPDRAPVAGLDAIESGHRGVRAVVRRPPRRLRRRAEVPAAVRAAVSA